MRRMIMCVAVMVLAGCGMFGFVNCPIATAVSPDGKNEIRLWTNPLTYEVLRDGVTVVAKTEIGIQVDGRRLVPGDARIVRRERKTGRIETPVYKKSSIDLSAEETSVDFGDWAIRLAARNDGVAYRFETKFNGKITVDGEAAPITIPEKFARCWANTTGAFGQEESIPFASAACDLKTGDDQGPDNWMGNKMIYLPFAYSVGGKYVAVTESDVRDYPIWNLASTTGNLHTIRFDSRFAHWPKKTHKQGEIWLKVDACEPYLTRTEGSRTFPWRTFILADRPTAFCEADIVYALAPVQAGDFTWVNPGKVAWDWWNSFDNQGNEGCNTKTYERFVNFAARTGVEYVILDEGWSDRRNIWKTQKNVDLPHIVSYANERGVGIILWMGWAQAYGDEERVAAHFAKLGAKGFKVDFMDRGDADCAKFRERFAAACARHRMLVDYHGAYRPTGLQRMYPNVVNFEGIHGLEHQKWPGHLTEAERMRNDVMAFYLRLTAGPMDYTPGAMLNHAIGTGWKFDDAKIPGAIGTRCRQMAMMVLYEAPLQMLCDSPTNYERNMESYGFMAKVPVVWADVVGLVGDPDSMIVSARKSRDGSWFAAGLTNIEERDAVLDTSFLGGGLWKSEIFRDAPESNVDGTRYVHERDRIVRAGEKMEFHMARGGGFVVRFTSD